MDCALSESRTKLIMWTLLFLSPIISMSIDLIAPSLPAIVQDLHAPDSIIKKIMSVFILGYGCGNFCMGFLTDAWGRQKLLRISLIAFIIISLLPVLFPSVSILLFSRFLQGFTIGSAAVLVRTIFADIFPPEKLTRLGTLMGTMFGLGPVIGPVIGGYLQFYFGWKAGFCFFAIISLLLLIAVFFTVPETHLNTRPLNLKNIQTNLAEIFTHKKFMGIVILMGMLYSLIISFNTVGPFLVQTKLHYSPIFFGHLALGLGIAFLASTFICRYLLGKYNVDQIYFFGINFFFGVAILSAISSYFFKESVLLIGITGALMFFVCGFIFPMSMGRGLSFFRHAAGTATATMFFLNMLITSFMGTLASFVPVENNIPLMWIYFILLLFAMIMYWGFIREPNN